MRPLRMTRELAFVFAGLVRFHEGLNRFLSALRTDLQVVAVVWEGLVAPFAPLNSWGLHLGDFFEQ